ncbi:carotenoid oxygenase family protein [Spongiactinospora sp. TRM90649]|uniref:carotenoid oxygenase family protein n=1 Tax=Spongiactinospora sp. TRM90649 TaxID=3031114 RepID=UPI0023F64625|nr:carotenoid oxygenase family protein [Spongiactinospora sp. TRM90649]MDF5755922.1 carotenoid oxygenase family protein [Spongiactinospora sp. TRM90649]
MPSAVQTPFRGGYVPVTEEITAFDLPVTGTLPDRLNGRFLRNGPNPLNLEEPNQHLFTGEGMVHGVRLRDGRAEWYRNRWVRSDAVALSLGETPRPGPRFEGMDFAANTHVIGHAGRTLALVEAGFPAVELTYELDTVGRCDFGGSLPGGFTAHSKLDPRTGELHAVCYYFGRPDVVQHVVADAAGRVVRAVDVAVEDGPMMHDFGLTDRYVVLYDLPVTFSVAALEAGIRMPYAWDDRHPARVGLLPRDGDGARVRWFEVDPCWVFHTLNAYEDGDRVVVDVVAYDRLFVDARLDAGGPPALDRWVLDTATGKAVRTRLDDRNQEFPRIDDRRTARQHRYGYTVVTEELRAQLPRGADDLEDLPPEAFGAALLKHDLRTGGHEAHRFPRDAYAGEPVFVPADPSSSEEGVEDDGYVMTYVHNPDRGAADLVILSAQDFEGDPVATVHLPARVPLGFHGGFIPDTH